MIRWYDIINAIACSYFIAISFFTIPFAGAIIAYVIYEYGWNWYCQLRLKQETQ